MTHKMSSCILFLSAGSDLTSLCFVVLVLLWFCVFFCLFWFGCGFVCFVCLVAFVFGLWFVFDGTAHWTVYWSITSAFEAIDVQTALHDNLQFIFLLRLNVCNDLAKAMKALEGKKS